LLDMACINFLFHRYPDRDPHWLTEHKMAMVSNQFLAALCVALGFHKHMRSLGTFVQKHVEEYVLEISEARIEAEEEALKVGKSREECCPDYWVHTKQPPKCLPDMVEAFIGALFVDSDYNYSEVERFFDEHIKWYFEDMTIYDTFANKHPTTFLTNWLSLHMGCSKWRIYAQKIPSIGNGVSVNIIAGVMIHKEIVADAHGTSARYAKISASKKALEMLEGLPLPDYRATYHCDCKPSDEEIIAGEIGNVNIFEKGTAI